MVGVRKLLFTQLTILLTLKAAGVCLMLLATCCQDDIVPHVLPFVKENIKHTDWRLRDASIMAFGAILEGPDPTNLKPIVEQAMPMLIELMTDKSVIVKVSSEIISGDQGFHLLQQTFTPIVKLCHHNMICNSY